MFDFQRLTDTLGSLLGGTAAATITQSGLLETLQNAGVDPALLDGLNADEIASLLAEHGIDPSQLPITEIEGLIQHLGGTGSVSDLLSSGLGADADRER